MLKMNVAYINILHAFLFCLLANSKLIYICRNKFLIHNSATSHEMIEHAYKQGKAGVVAPAAAAANEL